MLDITNVINVSVNQAGLGLGDYKVNNVCLFTSQPFLSNPDEDVFRWYTNASNIGVDLGTNGETYLQGVALFSQQPNILNGNGQLAVVPFLQGTIDTINASPTAGGTGYAVGNILSITTGGTNATVRVTAVSTGVVTGVELVTIGQDYTTGTGKATSAVTGTGTGCTVNITAIQQEPLIDAVNRVKEMFFFVGIISTHYPVVADWEDVSDEIQAMSKKVLLLPTEVWDVVGDEATAIKDAGNDHTRCLFYGQDDAEAARLYAAAYAGTYFSPNYDANRSTLTMNLKQLRTIAPDLTINQTRRDAANAAGVDIYPSISGLGKILSSSANNDADVVTGIIWLVSQLEVNGFNALARTGTKIPQTEPGVSVLKSAYREACLQAVNNAFVAPGEWNSPDTFGNQEDFLENIRNVGFYIFSEPVALQDQTDREAHEAPVAQIAVKLAGWIGHSNVILNFNP